MNQAAEANVDPSAARLAGVLRDPNGLAFTMGFVDGVMRPESATAAARELQRIAHLAPKFLPWYLRTAIQAGGLVAPIVPPAVIPAARAALRRMVEHLIIDARPAKLGEAIERIRETGARININLLGEAVLGEEEAQRRLDGISELIKRDDVDYVSVKVSAIVPKPSMWAFDAVVEDVVTRLRPLYLSAQEHGTFINLDMEEYRDLDLTVAVFRRILDLPEFTDYKAGIVLQAYLPDALGALDELTEWAISRVDAGGAPIKVRLVKGANLAMEHTDAIMHGWNLATYDTKLDSDANYIRCLDRALDPDRIRAVRIGAAGHNLFDIAYAWLLAGERDARAGLEFEMLLGMAEGQVRAVSETVGQVLLYVPVVKPDEFDVAISYLVRRLEESASTENFLSAAFEMHDDETLFAREENRFAGSIRRAADSTLYAGPRREPTPLPQPVRDDSLVHEAPADEDVSLTRAVLDIARGPAGTDTADLGDTRPDPTGFENDGWVETAVYADRQRAGSRVAAGAPGFWNTPDTDPAIASSRAWGRDILEQIDTSEAGIATIEAAKVNDEDTLEGLIDSTRSAAEAWGALPAVERGAVLRRAADELLIRRAQLIEVAASETGKVIAEADVEVSEAVDFARYYASLAAELDRVPGAKFQPARLTLVTPPWNFPVAIPAGGVLAALAAGSGVIFKPAPQARRCSAVVAEALWAAGVPRDVLTLVDIEEGTLGKQLVSHENVDRVILTGSFETAKLFRSWRNDLPLLAETSGKNAIIVTPSADLDLAAADVVKSAFGHGGQKCSAASLVILVGAAGQSRRFARQLVDATRSLRIGPPSDAMSEMGPLIEPPQGKLEWALTELDAGEQWLVKPRALANDAQVAGRDDAERYWTPGIRTGVRAGSRVHKEEFFGPVLGVMHASTLEQAIEIQNAVDYGLTAGIHTRDPEELELWLNSVQAGNLYVNRGITGAIVQRQPFGGWKRSAIGPGTKAGGPNYLVGLGSWQATDGAQGSQSLHLRGLDTRIATLIEAAQPSLAFEGFDWLRRGALSDAIAWDREFGQVKDVSGLGVERNLFRYRGVPVAVRATGEVEWEKVLRVAIAGVRAADWFTLSVPTGLPAAIRRALGDLEVSVHVETDDEWVTRISGRVIGPDADTGAVPTSEQILGLGHDRPPRARLVGTPDATAALEGALTSHLGGDPDLAVYAGEVTTAGRLELLPFLHEQAISITAHRYGNPDPIFDDVI